MANIDINGSRYPILEHDVLQGDPIMYAINLEAAHMAPKVSTEFYTLYKDFSWTGFVLLTEPGKTLDRDIVYLCPTLGLGSVFLVIDDETGEVLRASADHGEMCYPDLSQDERLMIIGADPLQFAPKSLDAIADAMAGGDSVLDLTEVQSANARHFISKLNRAGIKKSPRTVL
jgi:hypothetical protein